jgi:hypothetical protein
MKLQFTSFAVLATALVFALPAMAGEKFEPKYQFIQVKQFDVQPGVDLPPDYQVAIVEDLVKKLSKVKGVKQVLREGEALPEGQPVLLVTGTVTKFKKGNQAERYLVGFGAGETLIEAHINCYDANSKTLLLEHKVDGRVAIGIMGGKSESANGGLANEITGQIKDNFYSRDAKPPSSGN